MTLAHPPPRPRRRRRAATAAAAAAAVAVAAATALLPRTPPTGAGGASAAAPRGPFPAGCVWRARGAATEFAAPRRGWTLAPPPACTLAGATHPWASFRGGGETVGGGGGGGGGGGVPPPPPTRAACRRAACALDWAWLPGGGPSLHAVAPPGGAAAAAPTPLSRNLRLVPLAVADASAFARAAAPRVARGTTLLLDYPFYRHPGAIGHWAEAAAQVVAALTEEEGATGGRVAVDRVIILHAPRPAVTEWVRTALAAALAGERGPTTTAAAAAAAGLPPIILQTDAGAPAAQPGAPLEAGDDAAGWLLLERALVPRDVFTGGGRTFATPAAAAGWRAGFHAAAGVALPPARPPLAGRPVSILLLRKSADRRLLNEAALVDSLSAHGRVAVAEWTAATPVATQLAALARADVVVSAHTSALAAVHLLPPAAVVVEIIHRHWGWGGLDASFRDAAAARGGGRDRVSHAAWRARARGEAVPAPGRDGALFGHWSTRQCGTEACVEAATRGGVVVDVGAVADVVAAAVGGGRLPPWPEA